jgi:hypothetical protein
VTVPLAAGGAAGTATPLVLASPMVLRPVGGGGRWVECCWADRLPCAAQTASAADVGDVPVTASERSSSSSLQAAVLVALSRQALEFFVWVGAAAMASPAKTAPLRVQRHRSELHAEHHRGSCGDTRGSSRLILGEPAPCGELRTLVRFRSAEFTFPKYYFVADMAR